MPKSKEYKLWTKFNEYDNINKDNITITLSVPNVIAILDWTKSIETFYNSFLKTVNKLENKNFPLVKTPKLLKDLEKYVQKNLENDITDVS